MAVELRSGDPSDIDSIVILWQLANTARRDPAPPDREHEKRVQLHLRKADAFASVAHDGTALIGMAVGMQALEMDGAGPPIRGVCHITTVGVHPGRWGQGIGKRLMLHLLAEGQRRGYAAFQLWTHADNERAQRLYEHLGFVRSGREKMDDFGEAIVHYVYREPASELAQHEHAPAE